jgi:hypothetical protein
MGSEQASICGTQEHSYKLCQMLYIQLYALLIIGGSTTRYIKSSFQM